MTTVRPPSTDGTMTFSGAYAALRSAQKPNRGAPPYSRLVNRRAGRVLAALAYRLQRTPDQVTMASALVSFVALVLFAAIAPNAWLGPVVTVLLLVAYALDSADGQLARLRGGGSAAGEWLDHVVDAAKIVAFHSVIVISVYRFQPEFGLMGLLIPLAFLLVSSVFFFGMMLTDQLRRIASARQGGVYAKQSTGSLLQALAAVPTDYGILCLVFLLAAWPFAFMVAYGILLAANAIVLVGVLFRWYRELRRL